MIIVKPLSPYVVWHSPAIAVVIVRLLLFLSPLTAAENDLPAGTTRPDITPRPVQWIPPGTRLGNQPPAGWSHLVMLAHPRLAAGDVDELPSMAAGLATSFKIVLLANVRSTKDKSSGANSHVLDEVAFGIGKIINGKTTIISSSTHKKLGAKLGWIAGIVLQRNEEAMAAGSRQVARTSTMCVLDFGVLAHHRGMHVSMTRRYVVVVDPESGDLDTLVGLLQYGREGTRALVAGQLHFLPPNYQEDRRLHVDGDKVFWGIPGDDAIAQIFTPAGTPVKPSDELRRLFTKARFQPNEVLALERAIRAAKES